MDHHPDGGAGGMSFAIGVDEAGSGAFDDEVGTAETADVRTLIKPAGEEPGGERSRTDDSYRTHGDKIERAIVDPGTRRDAGVVAVLIGVRDRDQKDVERHALFGGREDDALGADLAQRSERGADVGGQAS